MWTVLGWLIFVNVETGFYVEGVFLKKCPKFQENVDMIFMLLHV